MTGDDADEWFEAVPAPMDAATTEQELRLLRLADAAVESEIGVIC